MHSETDLKHRSAQGCFANWMSSRKQHMSAQFEVESGLAASTILCKSLSAAAALKWMLVSASVVTPTFLGTPAQHVLLQALPKRLLKMSCDTCRNRSHDVVMQLRPALHVCVWHATQSPLPHICSEGCSLQRTSWSCMVAYQGTTYGHHETGLP